MDKFLDKLEEVENEDDEEENVQDVNEALKGDNQYWKTRNKASEIQNLKEDEED
jgi:hypothetical protein